MKIKALRTKKEPREFVEICFHRSDKNSEKGTWVAYTGELPNSQPATATMELMKAYYEQQRVPLPSEINLDDYELVEFDVIESGVIGTDIRNKLTPFLNLIALIDIHLKDEHPEKKKVIENLIRKEIGTCKICARYLTKLL